MTISSTPVEEYQYRVPSLPTSKITTPELLVMVMEPFGLMAVRGSVLAFWRVEPVTTVPLMMPATTIPAASSEEVMVPEAIWVAVMVPELIWVAVIVPLAIWAAVMVLAAMSAAVTDPAA